MYRFDFDTESPRSRFGFWANDPSSERLNWNPKMREILGLPEASPSPTFEQFLEYVHPEDRKLVVQAQNEDMGEYSFRVRRSDGTIHMLHSLSIGGTGLKDNKDIASVVYDVTLEKRYLGEIQFALERYRALVEDMPALACRFFPDGTLTYVNLAYANAFGAQPGTIIGRNWLEFLPGNDRGFVETKIARLSPQAPTEKYDHWITMPSGTRRSLSWTYRGFFDGKGNLAEIQSIGLDLTEQRETERQIFHMSKLRSLGELAAATAHELFQPLSAIRLIAENLVATVVRERDNNLIVDKLNKIISQSERLQSVVEKMKSLGRPVSDVERSFPVREKIKENVDFLRYIFELDGVSVRLEDGEKDVPIYGNPDLFDQVIINLLMNAREAVVVEASNSADLLPEVRLEVETDRANGQVIIRVLDNGGGVNEELLPKIFEPFYTTKHLHGGTGLGLAICFSIVNQMKGHISAFNRNGGMTVEIKLPLAQNEPTRADAAGKSRRK